ncbi:hypothetical protein AB0M87_07885 [Streptomyces sp. NPDC051320]
MAPGTLPETLHRFLSDSGRKNLQHPNGEAWKVPPGQVKRD